MLIIIPIDPLKALVDMTIDAIEGQIDILESLGYSSQREAYIQRMRAQTEYASKMVQKTEEGLVEHIESCCEKIVHKNAEGRDGFIKLSRRIGAVELKEAAGVVCEAHEAIVKQLGQTETEAVAQIRKKFAQMHKDLETLSTKIENLRVR